MHGIKPTNKLPGYFMRQVLNAIRYGVKCFIVGGHLHNLQLTQWKKLSFVTTSVMVCLSGCLIVCPTTDVCKNLQIVIQRLGDVISQWYSSGLRAGWSGVRFPTGDGNFSLHHRVQADSGAHPASYPGVARALSPGVKRPRREADDSSSSAEAKECLELYLHSPIRLNGMVLS
jgi:hypothetical protein